MADKPNILVITTDQQSFRMMSCAGNHWLATPAMDRIASWGTLVSRTYCSDPVCVPSRYSWWTGRMPSSIGVRANERGMDRAPDEVLQGGLGHLLRRAGYEAVFGGKVHCPAGITAPDLGFDYITRDERDGLADVAAAFIRGEHRSPWLLAVNFINPHDICYEAIRAFASTDQDRRLLAGGTVELAELDRARALPEAMGEEAFYAKHCPPLPGNHEAQEGEPEAVRRLVEERPFRRNARERWSASEWRLHRWAYHRLTERVDAQIGIVLDTLEQSGQLESTVVVFTSDHGDHDASHRMEHKTAFYEEASRVPLVVAYPGHGPSGAVDASHIANNGLDLMATCCDYAGIDQPSWNRGRSWRGILEGAADTGSAPGSYCESQIGYMWVSGRYKYCRYDACGIEEQLYDLEADPGETRNCAVDEGMAGTLGRYRAALDAAMDEHRALRLT